MSFANKLYFMQMKQRCKCLKKRVNLQPVNLMQGEFSHSDKRRHPGVCGFTEQVAIQNIPLYCMSTNQTGKLKMRRSF